MAASDDNGGGAVAASFGFGSDGSTSLSYSRLWVFRNDVVIGLVAPTRHDVDAPVQMALDQRRRNGEITRGHGWILHDGLAYFLPDDADLTQQDATATGSWRDINLGYDSEMLREDVFLPIISWRRFDRPTSVAVRGASNAAIAERYAVERDYQILENSESVQAIWFENNGLYAVFRKAGSLRTPSGLVSVEAPCIIAGPKRQMTSP